MLSETLDSMTLSHSTIIQWYFGASFALVFLLPILDVLIFSPIYFIMPRYELRLSLLIALIISILTIISYSNFKQDDPKIQPKPIGITFTARILFGFSLTEIIMLIIEISYLYYCWPYLSKAIHLVQYEISTTFDNLLEDLFGMIDYETKQTISKNEAINFDGVALIISQTIRLMLIELKLFLSQSIRWNQSIRNIELCQQFDSNRLRLNHLLWIHKIWLEKNLKDPKWNKPFE